ncbi:MAG: DUF58 domain-containing protein [Halochromatium sp.]|nr:DUF58 domain-containing protein [Halochromatium sp.]
MLTESGYHRWLDGLMRRSPHDQQGVACISARRIYILPTSTGLTFGAMLFATLLGSLNYQNNLGLFLTFLMAGIALLSMHYCWYNLLGLSVRCADAEPTFCGQSARFRVELWNQPGRQHGELCLRGGDCAAIPAGSHTEIDLSLTTQHRGLMRLDELLIETSYPLGLFRAWALVRTPAKVLIYPRPAPQAPPPGLAIAPEQRAKEAARASQDLGADDFIGSRAYRAGDSPRQIDWKVLARERGLVTKQFGGDQAAQVQLDLRQHRGDLEQRLSLLTRQVLDADAGNRRYGLQLGTELIPSERGERHKRRCLEALARYPGDGVQGSGLGLVASAGSGPPGGAV